MLWLLWVNRVCAAVLYALLPFQGVVSGKEMSESKDGKCTCTIQDKIYNLAPLQSRKGPPRLKAQGSNNFWYSYNPCLSFPLGPVNSSDCYYGDVAICRWKSEESVYQNIGRQSTESCGFDRDTRSPQLVYTNRKKFPDLIAIVNLKCDPSRKSINDAKFEVIHDRNNSKTFQVTHKCACPDGCAQSGPTMTEIYQLIIGALSVVAVAGPFIVYFCTKRHDGRQQQALHVQHNEVDNHEHEGDDIDGQNAVDDHEDHNNIDNRRRDKVDYYNQF